MRLERRERPDRGRQKAVGSTIGPSRSTVLDAFSFPGNARGKSAEMEQTDQSPKQAGQSLTSREKLFLAPLIAIVLVGLAAMACAVGLLVASFFVAVPHWLWLLCFAASGAVLAGLLAEPHLRIFFGGAWMVFRNNVVYFWLMALSVVITSFKAFAIQDCCVILLVLVLLFVLDGAFGLGNVHATWRFITRRAQSHSRPT